MKEEEKNKCPKCGGELEKIKLTNKQKRVLVYLIQMMRDKQK